MTIVKGTSKVVGAADTCETQWANFNQKVQFVFSKVLQFIKKMMIFFSIQTLLTLFDEFLIF